MYLLADDHNKKWKTNITYSFLMPTLLVALHVFGYRPATHCRACQQCSRSFQLHTLPKLHWGLASKELHCGRRSWWSHLIHQQKAICLRGIAQGGSSWQHQYFFPSPKTNLCHCFFLFSLLPSPHATEQVHIPHSWMNSLEQGNQIPLLPCANCSSSSTGKCVPSSCK